MIEQILKVSQPTENYSDMSFSKAIYYVMQTTVFLAMFTKISLGGIPASGKCVPMNSEDPIDIRKLVGVWYQLERWSNLAEWPFKCISIKISPFFEMQSEVTWTGVNRYTNQSKSKSYALRAESDENDGRLVLGSSELNPTPKNSSIQVLITDYKNWGIVRECNNFKKANAHSEEVWVYTREAEPADAVYIEIEEAIVKLKLDTRRFYEVNQSENDCHSISKT